jgi:hypothetical protein
MDIVSAIIFGYTAPTGLFVAILLYKHIKSFFVDDDENEHIY